MLLCLALSLTVLGCAEGDKSKGDAASVPKDDFKPVSDTGKDSELYKRYEEYKENATLAFKDLGESDASCFEYEIDGVGAVISKYVGDENIVVVPSSIDGMPVVKVCEGAFSGASLRAVYIPDTVKGIEKGAFSECSGLSTLRLPFVGDGADNAFLGYIFGASSFDENAVNVPASLDMLIVGDGAVSLEDNALRGCKALSALILSDCTENIGQLALYDCADLVYVSLGDGVDRIGEYSFAHCSSLYAIDCSGVGEIGNGAFFSCSSINSIEYNIAQGDFLGRIFGAESYEYNGDFVPLSLRNVAVAEGCLNIPDMAFASCKYITNVILPESLESIGVRAFYACRSLKEIKIPDATETICDDAFFGCDSLSRVELGDSLESLGMQAFYGCKSLQKVSLPERLKEIKPSTFYGCVALAELSLGGVKTVGKDAFGACEALSAVSCDGIVVAEGNDALTGNKEEK